MMFTDYNEIPGNAVFAGAFNSEAFWRDEDLARLPAFNDESANNVVLAMDELQFLFCNKTDALVTRYAMDQAHRQYLDDIGFSFASNQQDAADRRQEDKDSKGKSVFQLLSLNRNREHFLNIMPGQGQLSPFGVIPGTAEMAHAFGLEFDPPADDIVKKVNSKVYSTELNRQAGRSCRIVTSSSELGRAGNEYLENRTIIIKDEFGVSGKGNIMIDSPAMLDRITTHVAKQEQKGKRVCFIIEPLLDCELDFSCQFFITPSGEYKLLSLQKIINRDFAYQGSFSPGNGLLNLLSDKGYFYVMEKTAASLFKDGYHGHVCIDSMLLADGSIVPVVEINARKSMSLLKHRLDRYAGQSGKEAGFSFLSVSYKGSLKFAGLLERLEAAGLLFRRSDRPGIIPLGANTLFINRDMDDAFSEEKNYKGRLYFASVADNEAAILEMNKKTREFMESTGFKLLN